jgi:hypothetical protein
VEYHSALTLPASYIVTEHQDLIKDFLDRHRIAYKTAEQPAEALAQIQYILSRQGPVTGPRQGYAHYVVRERIERYTLKRGDLIISLDQPARRLIPLLLEPQSLSSIFNSQEYSPLVEKRSDFFVYRVPYFGPREPLGDEAELTFFEDVFP